MKTLKSFAALMSAFALASAFGSGIAYGDEADATKPTSDVDTHIVSFGDSLGIERRSKNVSYGDLNLNNEEGVAVLYRRLQVASAEVCSVRRAWKRKCTSCMRDAKECYEDALSKAVDAVGSDLLLALHQGTEPPEMYAATPK
jgi:UrcA family protein